MIYGNLLKYLHYYCFEKGRRKGARNKKVFRQMLEKNGYFVEQVRDLLSGYPIEVYPDEAEHLTFAKAFYEMHISAPKRYLMPSDKMLKLVSNKRCKKIIEILLMTGESHKEIAERLNELSLKEKKFTEQVIEEYLCFFFNYKDMGESDRNLFFARVVNHAYYELHTKLYYGTCTAELALNFMGIARDKAAMPETFLSLIQAICQRMQEAVLKDDPKKMSQWAHSLGSIGNQFFKFGGKEGDGMSLADYVKITYDDDDKPQLTVEDIQRHNDELEKKGNEKIKPLVR